MAKARHKHLPSPDARRLALNGRLRNLKGVAVGVSATLALGLWWLVTGAVASTGQQATGTLSQQNVGTVTDPNRAFFGSGSSLGAATGQVPMMHSGGS